MPRPKPGKIVRCRRTARVVPHNPIPSSDLARAPAVGKDHLTHIVCDTCFMRGMTGHFSTVVHHERLPQTFTDEDDCDTCFGPLLLPNDGKSQFSSGKVEPYICHRCMSKFTRSDRLLSHSHIHHGQEALCVPVLPP